MLVEGTAERPDNFTFMIIDHWSSEPYYNAWDIRGNYRVSLIDNDLKIFTKFMQICGDLLYFHDFPTIVACYNLGLPHDHELFYKTYDFFYQNYALTNDVRALKYMNTIVEQLVSNGRHRTKTLNKYFKNDFNLLILEKEALEFVIEKKGIKDIVVIGASWEHCLRYRPVGLKNVDITDCNYYIIPDLCYKIGSSTVSSDDLNECQQTTWVKCEDHKLHTPPVDMYKLIGVTE